MGSAYLNVGDPSRAASESPAPVAAPEARAVSAGKTVVYARAAADRHRWNTVLGGEDRSEVVEVSRNTCAIVADGHGGESEPTRIGDAVVEVAKNNFEIRGISSASPSDILRETFTQVQEVVDHLQNPETNPDHYRDFPGGATAAAYIIDGATIHAANIGDAMVAVMRADGSVVVLSELQNTHNPAALQAARDRGAQIAPSPFDPTPRLRNEAGLGLMVTSAIGDSGFPGLGHEPHIATYPVTPNDLFVIAASDGLVRGGSPEMVERQLAAFGQRVHEKLRRGRSFEQALREAGDETNNGDDIMVVGTLLRQVLTGGNLSAQKGATAVRPKDRGDLLAEQLIAWNNRVHGRTAK